MSATEINEHLASQVREALGAENRWYCSQHYGCEVTDPDKLLEYYIKHGGAEFFRKNKCGEPRQN
jgi:hypothetical protein